MFRFVLVVSYAICASGVASPLNGRIVGGDEAAIEDIPWQVSLMQYGNHHCGGAIVSPTVVMTAARCIVGTNLAALQVRAGSSNRTDGGTVVDVIAADRHPRFNPNTYDFDIGVLRLGSPLTFGPGILAVMMAEQNETVAPGEIAQISGWGTLSSGGGQLAEILQAVEVRIVDQEKCVAAYDGYNRVTDNMICAGVPGGGRDACHGDTGGPLVVGDTLVGVASWSFGCAISDFPGVYTSVASLREWFDANSQ